MTTSYPQPPNDVDMLKAAGLVTSCSAAPVAEALVQLRTEPESDAQQLGRLACICRQFIAFKLCQSNAVAEPFQLSDLAKLTSYGSAMVEDPRRLAQLVEILKGRFEADHYHVTLWQTPGAESGYTTVSLTVAIPTSQG